MSAADFVVKRNLKITLQQNYNVVNSRLG